MGCARATDDAEPVAAAHCRRCAGRRRLWRPLCAVAFRAAEVARDHGVDPARQVLQEPLRATPWLPERWSSEQCPPERRRAERFVARRARDAIPASGSPPFISTSRRRTAAPARTPPPPTAATLRISPNISPAPAVPSPPPRPRICALIS